MRPQSAVLIPLSAALILGCGNSSREMTETTTWRGPVPADGWLRLRNVNGDITVSEADGDSAEVRLTVSRGSNRAPVGALKLVPAADAIIACVVFGEDARCAADDYKSGLSNDWNNGGRQRVTTTFDVRLPRGVRLDAQTSNSDISIIGARRDVIATTSNSDITVDGGAGPLRLSTSNSDIDIRLDSLRGPVEATTSNSDITLVMPEGQNAELTANTSNGEIDLAFPGLVKEKSTNRLAAALGTGAFKVALSTSNSSISIRPKRERN